MFVHFDSLVRASNLQSPWLRGKTKDCRVRHQWLGRNKKDIGPVSKCVCFGSPSPLRQAPWWERPCLSVHRWGPDDKHNVSPFFSRHTTNTCYVKKFLKLILLFLLFFPKQRTINNTDILIGWNKIRVLPSSENGNYFQMKNQNMQKNDIGWNALL